MEILDMARQLGEAIRDSEIMSRVKAAEQAQQNDAEAQKLIGEYNLARMQLAQRAQKEDITKEEMEEIQKALSAEFEKLTKNAVISEFLESRAALDAIVNQVEQLCVHASGSSPVMKCVGIGLITNLAGQVCRDAQQGTAASAVELCGVFCALYAALPLVESLLTVVERLV